MQGQSSPCSEGGTQRQQQKHQGRAGLCTRGGGGQAAAGATTQGLHAHAASHAVHSLTAITTALPLLPLSCHACRTAAAVADVLQLNEIIDAIKSAEAAPRVGHLPKEQPTGAVAELWTTTLAGSGLSLVDAGPGACVCLCGRFFWGGEILPQVDLEERATRRLGVRFMSVCGAPKGPAAGSRPL